MNTHTYGRYSHTEGASNINFGENSHVQGMSNSVGIIFNIFPSEYNENTTYTQGNYCFYDNQLYQCQVASTTGEWAQTDWTLIEAVSTAPGSIFITGSNNQVENSNQTTVFGLGNQVSGGNVLIVGGQWSQVDSTTAGNYLEIIGNGQDSSNRHNARILDKSGNETLTGNLRVEGTAQLVGGLTSNSSATFASGLTANGSSTFNGVLTVNGAINTMALSVQGNRALTVNDAKTLLSNFLDEYDSTKTYAVNDKCFYELTIYKCTAPTTGDFDSTKWTKAKFIEN